MRGSWRRPLVLLGLALLLPVAGCVPSDPVPSGPLAIRKSGEQAEVLYTDCTPGKIAGVAVLAPTEPPVFHDADPAVWKVTFPGGSTATSFMVGETPAGATVDVPLAAPLAADRMYMVVLTYPDGNYAYEAFELAKMGDRVAYDNRYLTPDDFTRASICPTH